MTNEVTQQLKHTKSTTKANSTQNIKVEPNIKGVNKSCEINGKKFKKVNNKQKSK